MLATAATVSFRGAAGAHGIITKPTTIATKAEQTNTSRCDRVTHRGRANPSKLNRWRFHDTGTVEQRGPTRGLRPQGSRAPEGARGGRRCEGKHRQVGAGVADTLIRQRPCATAGSGRQDHAGRGPALL